MQLPRILPILYLLASPLACNTSKTPAPAPDPMGPGHGELTQAYVEIQNALWAVETPDGNTQQIFDQALPLLKTHLGPLKDTLKKRGDWRLTQVPDLKLDRAQYDQYRAEELKIVNEMFTPEKLEQFFPGMEQFMLLAWDATRVAQMTRTQVHLRFLGPAGMGRRAMIDNLAPPAFYAIDRTPDAPVFAIATGPEIMVVHLKRTNGAYLPTSVEWLLKKGVAAPEGASQ
ncbi:MAG: hypothetical protein ACE366_03555 [Bradymonadia bacterium]